MSSNCLEPDSVSNVKRAIPTRLSLLSRLKDWNDQDSWKVFFDTYWRLIYNAAIRAGLTDAEAQDVVQDTVIAVSKSLIGGAYDAKKGSFKTWLMTQTRWRIVGQYRKRQLGKHLPSSPSGASTRTDTVERIPDQSLTRLETLWDEEWETNLLDAAMRKIKTKVDPKHYQVFDLHVRKGWPVAKVAKDMKINRTRVYFIKHRLGRLIKTEVLRLQIRPI